MYGSATRSGVDPDQGPVTDVITVTLYLLAHVDDATTKVSAIETVSSVIGQGLLVTFQTNAPFKIADPALLVLLQRLFADKEVQDPSSSASVVSPPPSPESTRGSDVAPAALRFIVSNLRLLALAADASIAAPQNLLAPRAAITVLMNVGSSLLAHVIQRLSTLQASKDRPAADTPLLQQTRSECKAATADVETVLHSMNPAWKDEIALLRSLSSQIGVIHQLAHSLAGSSTSSTLQLRGKKAETMQDAQRRATWDHFLDAAATTAADKPPVEPEMALLMHLVVDERLAWSAKLDAIKTLFLARRVAAAPSVTLEKSLTAFYFELLVAAIDACASVVEMPPGFKGAEVYAAIWRNALCGMVPEIVLQLEQWLDVHPDLPLRGQRVEAPHVRFERALRAALLVMADRLDVCETAVSQPAVPNGATDATTGAEMDVVGLDTPPSQPIKAWLLRACIEHSLARPEAIADEFPEGHKLASEVQNLAQSLRMDAQLEGLALNTLFETRVPSDDPMELLQRVASDPGTHCSFARQLVVQVHAWLEQHDLESIARWCRALGDDATHGGAMLDTVMLYIDPPNSWTRWRAFWTTRTWVRRATSQRLCPTSSCLCSCCATATLCRPRASRASQAVPAERWRSMARRGPRRQREDNRFWRRIWRRPRCATHYLCWERKRGDWWGGGCTRCLATRGFRTTSSRHRRRRRCCGWRRCCLRRASARACTASSISRRCVAG